MKRIRLHLYTATRRFKIAHVQLQVIQRDGHEYLYLQWKDGRSPKRVYVGQLAGACCRRRRSR